MDAPVAAPSRSPARNSMIAIALVSTLAIALFAFALYVTVGRPAASGTAAPGAAAQHANGSEFQRQVTELASKLEGEPDNAQGWAMLARSYKVMGRAADAQRAFERAGSYVDEDAGLLADYADVAAANAGGNFAGKPARLLAKALKLDPANPTALWLVGTAAANAADYAGAAQAWQRLLDVLPPDDPDRPKLQVAIEQVRAKAGQGTSAPAGAIDGTVQLDPTLTAGTRPDDTVMVLARAPGAPVPVAVLRARAADLPLRFRLDDSLALDPRARISQLRLVEVEARISKSGQPVPQAGDLMSAPATVQVGSSGVALKVALVRH